ncbi:MAG: hypothetical protein MR601_02835 [Erysipelotrichaceae bacterium]|nr:hypothetical protein [Erysipelotrichaceae bacterium]
MKKIICLLLLILLVGCSIKNESATTITPTQTPIFQFPIPTPTITPTYTPTMTPITTRIPSDFIDRDIYNIYLEPEYIPPEIPETLDDVDFSKFDSEAAAEGMDFICPKGDYYGYFENLEKPYISMTLRLGNFENQNSIRFILAETEIIFFVGVFNRIDKDFYSYYGYTDTDEKIYDESFIRYFKYEDGYIYIYPDGLSMEEMQSYKFNEKYGCKLY